MYCLFCKYHSVFTNSFIIYSKWYRVASINSLGINCAIYYCKKAKEKRKVSWAGEEEEMTVEEIRKRIDMLESIYAGDRTQESEEEIEKNFIEGNDTLH